MVFSDSFVILLRTFILAIGWPVLIVGSIILVIKGRQFFRETKGTIFGRLVFPTVLGWLVTMYILGVTATFYMFDVPYRGTLVVLPVFLVWAFTFITLSLVTWRWSFEALRIKNIYESLEKEVEERTKQLHEQIRELDKTARLLVKRDFELSEIRNLQEEQIRELDKTAKLLVQRDFELQQANELFRELDQAKTQFVSVAAHQLRTPLSVSKWTYQMLLSGDFGSLNEEQRQVLERGNITNEQMIDLVSDLLDVARIESGRFQYVFKPVDLAPFLSQIREFYMQKAREKQITCEIEVPEEKTLFVKGDEIRLRMIFQNLLDNAFKFTEPNGHISLFLTPAKDTIMFGVKDTGIGIRKEDFPRLFTKFFRGRNAISADTRGTGLGLYIVWSIVRSHDGRIWVESQEGKGSTFYFTLPRVLRDT